MKIVIVSPAYPLRGGIANFTAQLYKELINDNEVSVFNFKRQYPEIFFPGKTQFESGEDADKIPTEIIIDSINPLSWKETAKKIINLNPDLVIFAYWLPFFAPCYSSIAKRIKKKTKTKLLALCHNIIPHEKRPGDKLLTKSFLVKMDYFVALSKDVKKDLEIFIMLPKCKVLPHPVYSRFGEQTTKEQALKKIELTEARYILFFGFIRDYKGLDILIESLALVKEKIKVKLIVAGEFYEDDKKYKSLINKLKLDDDIILFSDFIPANNVKYYFSAADAVILPYKSATQSGIVQIAVNFRKPVIASNVGGLGEVIKNNETGYIVEPENPNQLADAIIKFYDENKENEFSNNISKIAEQYSWKNFANGIFDLVNS
jgi:glycosyltransferase involved in cell wall biosynthesis